METEIKNIKDSELKDILVESYKSTKVLAKVFFPERFSSKFSKLHDEIFDVIDSGAPRVAIAAPRGIGKTSIVGLALAGKRILFQDSKFLPYVSNSFDSAVMQTENLKIELSSNQLVRTLFGDVKTTGGEYIDKTFSKKSWIARFQEDAVGTLVYPRGSGQQIRGLIYRNSRPDFFIIDDLEDTETIENEEIRKKRETWFFADLMKAVSRLDKGWRVVYIDTLKHEDSLLQHLLDSSDWESLRLELCDDNLKSNAPEFVSDEEVAAEHASHKEKGLLDVFYREFRNIAISKEDAVFQPGHFRYFVDNRDQLLVYEPGKTEPVKVSTRLLTHIVIVDPAKTEKLESADSAVLTIAIDRSSKRIFVRNVVAGKLSPSALLDAMFEQVKTYKAMILAVETTGLESWISQPIENEMRVRSIFPIYHAISASGSKKKERVAALSPYYRLGYIYHNRICCQKLESQLTMFPRSKLWDVMDGLSHLLKILDDFAQYFDPEDFGPEDDDKEFKDLLNEDEDPVKLYMVA